MASGLGKTSPADLSSRGTNHDLRNLFAIIASARNLGDVRAVDTRAQLLDALGNAALRGGELTTSPLAGESRKDMPSVIDANRAVTTIEPMLRAITGVDVILRADLRAGQARVAIDRDAFDAVTIELVRKARRACGSGGTIWLRTRLAGDRLRVVMADDGRGMSAGVIKRLLTGAPAEAAYGSGIGRVRALAAKAHGVLRIHSREGRGTLVSLNLPTVPSLAADEPPACVVRASPKTMEPENED